MAEGDRLTEIEERRKTALGQAPAGYYMDEWPAILKYDMPYLLAEVKRLTAALDEAREALETCDERARLEADVVEAALAERRASLALKQGHLHQAPPGAEQAWADALTAYEAAVDVLLAFLGEGKDD